MPALAVEWNHLLIKANRSAPQQPPVLARRLYYFNLALHDALTAVTKGRPKCIILKECKLHVCAMCERRLGPILVSAAAFHYLHTLYPDFAQGAEVATLLERHNMSASKLLRVDVERVRRLWSQREEDKKLKAYEVGLLIAHLVLQFSQEDGARESESTPYSPYNEEKSPLLEIDPNRWQPLPGQSFMCPGWGRVRGHAICPDSVREFKVTRGVGFGCPCYDAQVEEVVRKGSRLTPKQKATVELWHFGFPSLNLTPAEQWVVISFGLIERDCLNLRQSLRVLLCLTAALFDASIACWWNKRHYSYVRPITAVRYLYYNRWIAGINSKVLGQHWLNYLKVTPPFPGHPSGHATFSGAAATCLIHFFGDRLYDKGVHITDFGGCGDLLGQFIVPKFSSRIETQQPERRIRLKFKTLTAMAKSAAESRLLGGFHFRFDNEEGLRLGVQVAEQLLLQF